jgi:DNA-binding XRE family transcriptional regulator
MNKENRPFTAIADRIRWHRALLALDQKSYAQRLSVTRSSLNNWESGDYRLSLDGALSMRRTFGLSLDFMFEGIDDALSMTLREAWRDRLRVNNASV